MTGSSLVGCIQFDDVTRNEVLGFDLAPIAFTKAQSFFWNKVFEVGHEGCSLGRLHVGEQTSHDNNKAQHTTKEKVVG